MPRRHERQVQRAHHRQLAPVCGALAAAVAPGRPPMIAVEETAAAIADAVEADVLPLRLPVGAVAGHLLAARHAAPDDTPFALARSLR
jgi:hypothetical protein